MSRSNCVNLVVLGASGRIGRQVLAVIAAHRGAPRLRVVAVANSRAGVIARDGLPAVHAADLLATGGLATMTSARPANASIIWPQTFRFWRRDRTVGCDGGRGLGRAGA